MPTIQPIQHHGRVVAFVADGRALIADEGLGPGARALVRGKCLYALEIHAGERPGPYRDDAAGLYAQRALERRQRRSHRRR